MTDTVLVLRACRASLTSYRGFQWPACGPVEAPDWTPVPSCEGGLFGVLWGRPGGYYAWDHEVGARWLVVEVDPADLVEMQEKVKFSRGNVVCCGSEPEARAYLDERTPAEERGYQRAIHDRVRGTAHGAPASPARQLVGTVWTHATNAGRHSWRTLNSGMYRAVLLAVEAGLKFDRGDFADFSDSFRMAVWGGSDGHMLGERFYSAAVNEGNISAAQSFEAWTKRAPFVLEGKRLAIGSELIWKEQRLKVTSFAKDGLSLTACAYAQVTEAFQGRSYPREKLSHRVRITLEELREHERDLKAEKKAAIAKARGEEGSDG